MTMKWHKDQKIQTKIKKARQQRSQEYIDRIKSDSTLYNGFLHFMNHFIETNIKKTDRLWVNPQHPKYNYHKENLIQHTAVYMSVHFDIVQDVDWRMVVRGSFDVDAILEKYNIQ